ncbi:MAG: hypothetical protein ACXWUP_10375 [Allosphingosinicella sp.]
MKNWKFLQNPIAMTLQGFAVGTFLFFTVQPLSGGQSSPNGPATESVLSGLEA